MSDNTRQLFVKRLNEIMEMRGITQADICVALDVSSAIVSNWCTGKKMPRIDKVQRLSELLNVPMSALLQEDGMQNVIDGDRLEALHQNPRLGLLFDRQRRMSEKDIEAMLSIADAILRERDHDD